jgi:uncharacterized membrane protein
MHVRRALPYIIGGLLLGGLIHVVIVLLIPLYGSNDAWAQMQRFGREGEFHTLPRSEPGAEPMPSLDPRMVHAVCRFDLGDGPIRIRAQFPDEFWSLAVFDRRGRNVYSLNDRAVEGAALDLIIMTPLQMAQIRQNPPASLDSAIVIELEMQAGFVLLRAFVPDDSMLPAATAALDSADCTRTL